MNEKFEDTKRKTNGKRGKLELIVGIWTGVVIVLLVSSVSFALVKLNQSVTTQNKNVASGVSSSAVQAEPAPVSEAAISSGSSINENVNTVDLFKNQFVYTSDVVNVRSQPSTISRIVVKLKAGTRVQLSKKYDNDWAEIIYNGLKCYIMSRYLSPTAPEASQPNTVVAPTATPRRTSAPKKTQSPTPSPTATEKTDDSKNKSGGTSASPAANNNSGDNKDQASSSPTPSGSNTPTSTNP